MKSQKKRANEAKKRENSNRGRKVSKRIPVFLLYPFDFTAYFSHFSKYPPPYSPILRVFRISSPHFHLFSVVCIDTRLRHPQSGATFQHLRKFHPCFVHGKALLRSFSPHLQCNRKKNCAFSHFFFIQCIVFCVFSSVFSKICFCQEHGRDSIVSHETFSIQLFFIQLSPSYYPCFWHA